MPYPTLYDVAYSCAGFQRAQGNNSFPGSQIDADLAGQVMVWAESPYARMFRNDLHNISLCEEIERRARERRAAHIQNLLTPNDGSGAVGV